MTRVELRVARQPFRLGTIAGHLDELDANDIPTGKTLFRTRGHETWASAARSALHRADTMAWKVIHRDFVMTQIAEEDVP